MTGNCSIDRNAADATTNDSCREIYRPHVDIFEDANEFVVKADMPGVTAKEVDIQFEKGVLSMRARVAARQIPGATPVHREYGVGDFAREFRIGEGIDASKVSAQCADGVLTLRLPKLEAARPRRIEVK